MPRVCLLIELRLRPEHLSILSAGRYELIVRAGFDDTAVLQNDDAIDETREREAMTDDDRCLAGCKAKPQMFRTRPYIRLFGFGCYHGIL